MQIRYKNKIVAFIDVLGFSNLVYSKSHEDINRYFERILNNFSKAVKKNYFHFHIISDSIVVSADLNEQNLIGMVKMLSTLQCHMLLDGILLRGSISLGELYLNKSKNIIVGAGLVNAYQLESLAIYPRIIIDRRFIRMFYSGTKDAVQNLEWVFYNPSAKYKPDFIYLNYTAHMAIYHIEQSKNAYDKLLISIKKNYYNNEYIEKYEWLKEHILFSIISALDYFKSKPESLQRHRNKVTRLENALNEFNRL